MADKEHLAILKQGVGAWNAWRRENLGVRPDLTRADLSGADLGGADLDVTDLQEADLRRTNLQRSQLDTATLQGANLTGADLRWAHLTSADLKKAKLCGANLRFSNLIDADLTGADLTGALVYGVSAWKLTLKETTQRDLNIAAFGETEITVDNIEIAQFIYLLLNNQKIRDVIDTITSKAVLILGRFTPERKAVLDTLREELRQRGYVPILFDFDKPGNQTTVETITLLARMARFVIADLSDAKSILQELQAIVPNQPTLAVQPLILASQEEPGMFDFFRPYPWVLKTHRYDSSEHLIVNLSKRVIGPTERKVLKLRGPAAQQTAKGQKSSHTVTSENRAK